MDTGTWNILFLFVRGNILMSYYNKMRLVGKEIIRNRHKPFFKWKRVDGRYNVDIINDEIESFFYLVINSKNMYDVGGLVRTFESNDSDILFKEFVSDAIMSTLNDSISNIQKFFKDVKNRGEYPELFKDVFFSDADSFIKQLKKFLLSVDYPNKEKIIIAAEINAEIVYFNIPKLLLPWYIHALGYTVADNPEINVKNYNEMVIVKKSKLPLHFTKSENPIEFDKFIRAQMDFKNFILALNKCENDEFNKSLNLYIFNETTNLFDIHKALKMFVNDSYFYGKEYENEVVTPEDKLYHRNSRKFKFEEISSVSKINNLGVKAKLIDDEYYSEALFLNKMLCLIFNLLFKEMKRSLIEFMTKESELYCQDIPRNIRTDFGIYDAFSKMEPFSDILEEVISDELNIYDESGFENSLKKALSKNLTVQEETILEAYGYAYKSFYRARNPLKKSINTKEISLSRKKPIYGKPMEVILKVSYPNKYKS